MNSNYRILILFLLLNLLNYGQNENRFWCFGKKAGLDFGSNPPSVYNLSQMIGYEGCSTISDANGNLLFYTAGDTVWNKQNQIMANGTGLFSGYSNTQAAQIVKWPGSPSKYFLFTLSKGSYPSSNPVLSDTLYYHVVDMSLAAGNGSVVSKNILLSAGCAEKMTVTNHCNGNDLWLVVHQSVSGNFLAYKITSSGLITTPVVSTSSSTYNDMGQLKISPNGKKLAMANSVNNVRFTLYDFNSATGAVTNSLVLANNSSTSTVAYGCEFSPDGTKLFGTETGMSILYSALYQWDLCASNSTAIVNSIQSSTINASNKNLALQLASDGKIYMAVANSNSISVIASPNNYLNTANVQMNAVSIGNNKCVWGLPGINNAKLKSPIPIFTYSAGIAPGCNSFTFFAPSINLNCSASNYTSMVWNFNDPLSGSANTSSINNATHNFSAPGNYTVLLLLNTPCSTDTLKQVIGVNTPSLNVTGNVTLCPFQSCTLNVSGANSYTWSNGLQSNSVVLNPSVTTQYTISGTSSVTSCISTKTLTLIVNKCLQLTQEAEWQDVFTVFPNPANESVQVNSTVNLPISYVLLNQMGDIIWQGSKQSATFLLDLKNLQAGMYVLYLNNNKTTARVKLLKL